MIKISKDSKEKGLGLVDVIVGTALVLIVFLGIFGAFQLGLIVVQHSKNKIIATSIANQELEKIRNLPYESIGIIDGELPVPEGELEATTTVSLNDIEFSVERRIEYVSDEADGVGVSDECDLDYKRVKIKVFWSGRFEGEVELGTDFSPKDKVQEVASCEAQPGGILSVRVFDAFGVMVNSPLIEVFDPITDELIAFHTPISGEKDIPLATSTYKVAVSKIDYSTERSYGIDEVATPEKPHPLIIEGEVTEISFSIDKLSSFPIETLSSWGQELFFDSFGDQTQISEISNLEVSGGEVNLASSSLNGFLVSVPVIPEYLTEWETFSFNDAEPTNSDLRYKIYYASGTEWYLVPDSDLTGNSSGFDLSPIDLSGLDIGTYSQLKVRADFSRDDFGDFSPTLYDWQISWRTTVSTPIPNVPFNLKGEKIIGTDGDEDPVYKYSQDFTSDSSGYINILSLEWDSYTFTISPSSDLDLVETDPSPQPISLLPDTTQPVKLYLETENSLLVTILNIDNGEPVFDASVRLSKTGYESTQYTNDNGQTYFIPLEADNYSLEIQASGYLETTTAVSVLGDDTKIVSLEQIE